jgi:hypothetical protein
MHDMVPHILDSLVAVVAEMDLELVLEQHPQGCARALLIVYDE